MVAKIYGSILSTCTQRVVTVCKSLSIPYEIVNINLMTGEHKSEAFLAKQPFGQVPYLDDDGFIVYESRAMARYLAEKYAPGKLTPTVGNHKAWAHFNQAASVEQSNFDPNASGICVQRIFAPMRGGTSDEGRVTELEATLEGKLDGYERILSKQKYVAGNELTLVDIFHLPYGFMVTEMAGVAALKSDKRPHVKKWWEEITALKAWADVRTEVNAAMAAMKAN